MIVECVTVGLFQMNAYVVGCEKTREGALIDVGAEVDRILAAASRHGLRLTKIINTHGHLDHVEGVQEAKERLGVPFYLHRGDLPHLRSLAEKARSFGLPAPWTPEVDGFLEEGDAVSVGELTFRVLCTPGHSEGGVTFYREGAAFVGDALFAGAVGRTDLPGSSPTQLLCSIREKLLALPPETVAYPGPQTTIGREAETNPFLLPGAERLFL
ncbi:MAG: MBL fold metallo-hydrolase [Nitrospinota bacterium]